MRNVWCDYCHRDYTFFIPASSHEHAHNHGVNIRFTSEYGYYIGRPKGYTPEPEPEEPEDDRITKDDILDLAEQSDATWLANWKTIIDGFVQ